MEAAVEQKGAEKMPQDGPNDKVQRPTASCNDVRWPEKEVPSTYDNTCIFFNADEWAWIAGQLKRHQLSGREKEIEFWCGLSEQVD